MSFEEWWRHAWETPGINKSHAYMTWAVAVESERGALRALVRELADALEGATFETLDEDEMRTALLTRAREVGK